MNAVVLQVVGFLLEKGADVTLCNYSNQTAVHVANCEMQRQLLAINGTQDPQMQLLRSSWQGDLEQLQHLLVSLIGVDFFCLGVSRWAVRWHYLHELL